MVFVLKTAASNGLTGKDKDFSYEIQEALEGNDNSLPGFWRERDDE
jgi:hypothetical protein